MLNTRPLSPELYEEVQQPLRLVVGHGPPTTDRLALDRWASRELHAIFVSMRDRDGRVPSDGISDIRRGKRTPWRTLLRRIFEAIDADVSADQIAAIRLTLAEYEVAARSICQRQRHERQLRYGGRALRRAALIFFAVALGSTSACSNTIAGPTVASPPPRTVAVPPPSDVAHWVPAVRGVRP